MKKRLFQVSVHGTVTVEAVTPSHAESIAESIFNRPKAVVDYNIDMDTVCDYSCGRR